MQRRRLALPAALAVAASLAASAPAALAQGDGPPPPPTAASGAAVETVATGLATPTSFAFAPDGTAFAGVGPAEEGKAPSGLFTLAGGKATKVPGGPKIVMGLAWHNGRLFVSTGAQVVSYRDWDGTKFGGSRVVRRANKQLIGFNGLGFSPAGRLYAGVSLDEKSDAKKGPGKYANTVVSMRATGADLKIVARGLRQPWQMTFPQGANAPIVSDLSQESGKIPLDRLVVAKQGSNFGFPTCVLLTANDCPKYTKSLVTFPQHASPMGLATIGQTLYVALFGGLEKNKPAVMSMPVTGGTPTPFLSFAAPVVAVGANAGYVYAGDVTGSVYRVAAAAA